MSSVRRGLASFDAMLALSRLNHPAAASVVVSWDRHSQAATVMGVLDDNDDPLDLRGDVLARLSSVLARPFPSDVWRLVYPTADLAMSGQVIINAVVDEPAWARALDSVAARVRAGLRVATRDLTDVSWAALEAAGAPNGSAAMRRQVVFPELPDDVIFTPVELTSNQRGRGARAPWATATAGLPGAFEVAVLLGELARREEAERNRSSTEGVLLMDTIVTL